MLVNRNRFQIAAAFGLLLTGMTGIGARAGVIRDDRDQQSYLNLASDAKYASVGRLDITRNEPGFIGSGTLIAPNWVLTAAHLMDDATSVNFHLDNQDYVGERWFANPKWDGDPLHGNDIALVRLSQPVSGIAPSILNKSKTEFGQTATFVGYGRTGIGSTGATSYDGLKRAGQNTIDGEPGKQPKTYETKLKSGSKIFTVDFDDPTQPGTNVMGAPTPLDLEYLISFGDSGGAAFIDTPSGTLLAGIISYGEAPNSADDSGYGDITGQTRVASYASWIKKMMRKNTPSPARRELHYPIFGSSSGRELFMPEVDAVLQTDSAENAAFASSMTSVPEPAIGLSVCAFATLLARRPRRC